MISNAKKITAIAGAAVLSLGIAGPAFANSGGSAGATQSTSLSGEHKVLTTVELRTWVLARIDRSLAWIAKAEARVSASTKLTDAQKATALAKLGTAKTDLTTLRASVVAATSKDAIEAAIKASDVRLFVFAGHRHGHGCGHGWGDPKKDLKTDPSKVAKAAAEHKVVLTKASDPKTKGPSSVSVASATFVQSFGFSHSSGGSGQGSHQGGWSHQGSGSGHHGSGSGSGHGGHR